MTDRPELIYQPHGKFSNHLARPLRYWPVGGDLVITNGAEFSLYLPGRGGNLRLGIRTKLGVKWLNDTDEIVARYRPGSMVYEIKDALLMDTRTLRLTVLPLSEARGIIVRAELDYPWLPVELIWAFGGTNGMKGKGGGDIGLMSVTLAR